MKEEHTGEIPPSHEGTPPQDPLENATPPSLEGQLESLKAEVEESNREKDQFRQLAQRVQADFTNYKRRSEDEWGEHQKYANTNLILKLLPVLDDLDLAIDHAAKSAADASWLEGIILIQRKFQAMLETEDLVKIEVEGKEFDPLEHQAMAYKESTDHSEGQILEVIRDGYKLPGRVIRPALVVLAKEPESTQEKSSPTTGKETEDA